MPINGEQPLGESTLSGCWIKQVKRRATEVSAQTELLETVSQPAAAAQEQGEFYPDIDFAGTLPAYQRPSAYLPVLLETTGVTSHAHQLELVSKKLVLKESIVAKLLSIGADNLAEPLKQCHTEQSFAQCAGCKKVRSFWNRCENFYCPICQPTLARERGESLEWWTAQISQPKHVVVTVRNSATITWQRVKWFKACLTKLRRRKFARNWSGGLWSIECTNEGKGWHLHAHLLVDAYWIDPRELSQTWANIVGQDFAIVWVKDARGKDYLREVTKYAVKGSMLSGWEPSDIVHFINAFSGHRLFGVFGSLYGKRTQWREWIKSLGSHKRKCECGCDEFKVYSQADWQLHLHIEQIVTGKTALPPPKPALGDAY